MKYSITVEVQVDCNQTPEQVAQIAFDMIRTEDCDLLVSTMSGPQQVTPVSTFDLD